MEDKRITAEEILVEIDIDVKQMAQKVADTINNAQAGAIIDQSEDRIAIILSQRLDQLLGGMPADRCLWQPGNLS